MTRTSWMAALAGAAMLLTGGAARAGVVPFDPALNAASPLLTDVQFRGGGFGQRIHGGGHRGGFGRHGGFGRGGFGHRGGFGRGGFRHGGFGYHRGYGYRHGYGYRRGYGGLGVGAGLAGFAAGAALGSTLAPGYGAPAYAYDGAAPAVAGDATAYCESRFKSYNRATGTYTGYDGLKHACP